MNSVRRSGKSVKRRRVNKPAVIIAGLLLVATLVFATTLVKGIFSEPEDLAFLENREFIYDENENIVFNIDYTNNKKLNKVIEENVSIIYDENAEVFKEKNKDIKVSLNLDKEKDLASWTFIEEGQNLSEIYGSLIFNLKNNERIPIEKIYADNFEGLSMLVRENLAKDKDLAYNKTMYKKTSPEFNTFKYLSLSDDGVKITFKRDFFDNEKLDSTTLTYSEVMPYFSDEFNQLLDSEYVRPELSSLRYIDPSKPMVALTFDDGPNYDKTIDLGEYFSKNNSRVTFFTLGSRIEGSEDIVKHMHDLGHEIGNHSYNHPNFTKISDEELTFQADGVSQMIKDITKQENVILRPPYGEFNQNVRDKVNHPIIMWNVDPEDWKYRDEKIVFDNLKNFVNDGSIVVMHDLYETSTTAAKNFLDAYGDQYQFVTVSEMFAYRGIPLENGEVYLGTKGV